MSSKNVTVFVEKSKNVKSVLKKRYDICGKKVKEWKMSSKNVTVLLEISEKL